MDDRRIQIEVLASAPTEATLRMRGDIDIAADEALIYETITAPPIAAIPRRYTLDEVRYSPDLRARMRSVDIDTVTFESGSWEVAQGQAQKLSIIAASIRQALQRSPNEVFLVEGHTDATGSDAYNQRLSEQRAGNVADYLIGRGVASRNVVVYGFGETDPKSTNDTAEGRQTNRRVEIHIRAPQS